MFTLTGARPGLGVIMRGGESVETIAVSPKSRKIQFGFDVCILVQVLTESFNQPCNSNGLAQIAKYNL